MSDTLSLYHLEQTLVELMAMLTEPDLQPEEREAIEGQIKEYVAQEVRKVDNIRGYLKHCGMMLEAAKAEARAQLDRAAKWEAKRDALKDLVKRAMEAFEVKRLEGTTGAFSLRANGGKQPVIVDNPELVPDECCQYELKRLSAVVFRRIVKECNLQFSAADVERVPRMSLIEAALQKPCAACAGQGCILAVRQGEGWVNIQCETCGGSGKQGVPGAHLAERGNHVRVE